MALHHSLSAAKTQFLILTLHLHQAWKSIAVATAEAVPIDIGTPPKLHLPRAHPWPTGKDLPAAARILQG